LGGLDLQWANGDKFALVEAVALCNANNWKYPDWVSKVIGKAMVDLYRAVYPDVDLVRDFIGKKNLPEISSNELKLAERLKGERGRTLEALGLTIDRANAVQRRKETLRDMQLAELVAERCRFVLKPKPRFRGSNKAIPKLTDEFEKSEGNFPAECRGASEHMIKRAWSRYRDEMVKLHLNFP
jgi:hypothetical protein